MVYVTMLKFFVFIILTIRETRASDDVFDKRLQLDKKFVLSWKIEGDSITFQVEAQTLGWFGLGFGPGKDMADADLVVGGVKNGTGYLYDRHATANGFPPLDATQNYDLISGQENSTHTILKFKRKLDTGDKDDWKFSTPPYILWALNPNDAVDAKSFQMHKDTGYSDSPVAILTSTSPPSPAALTSHSKIESPSNVASLTGDIKSPPTSDFNYNSVLDSAGLFQLFWTFDDSLMKFQLHAATKGWAGIGFSPNGGMAGADIVVFWIDQSGKPVISDRHADHNGFPQEDASQDYTLISGVKNDTHLIVTFSRKRNTCDLDDWQFTADTTRVIYAANDAVPEDKNKFKIHTVRGTRSIYFFDKVRTTEDGLPPEKDAVSMEFHVNNVHIPDNVSTTYWCEVVRLPKVTKKMHIIKTEPAIQKDNIDIVHHIIMYVCSTDMSKYVGKGEPCFKEEGEDDSPMSQMCRQQTMGGWAVGGQGTSYPDNIGMPLRNDAEDMYVMMEMHYDNSELKKGKVDSSGMRVWLTEKLRPIEAAQSLFGLPVSADNQVIPPGVKEFTNYGYVSSQCTSGLPKEGIKIIGGLLHTHLAGRKVRLLHFRNGKQLPNIMSDEHYDFNYQDNRRLSDPVTVLPGDEMVVECVYETLTRNKTTFSGHATHDEMCLIFVDYYPAVYRGWIALGFADKRELFKDFGINFVPYNASKPLDRSVRLPDGKTKPLQRYLRDDHKFDWTPEKIKQFQDKTRNVKYDVICIREDASKGPINFTEVVNGTIEGLDFFEQYGYPNFTEPLVVPDVCNGKKGPNVNKDNIDHGKPQPQQLRERPDNAGDTLCKRVSILVAFSAAILVYLRG